MGFPVTLTDVNGNVVTPSGGTIGAVNIADPTTPANKAQVAQFHNADNQNPGGTAYGVLTGGVAQLLNASGNLDRQRETGMDNIPPIGVSSSGANFVMTFKQSIALAITLNASPQAVTPSAMSGTIGGVAWSIQVGSVLVIDSGANKEVVLVTAITATTFTAIFTKNHGTNTTFTGATYNQERDAAGEADGATGIGTAVAAEYEFNGGHVSGGNFDRARSVQAKGRTTTSISAGGGQGSTSFTVGAAGTIKAGMQVLAYKSSTFPAANSFESLYVDLSYVEGTTTVPLSSAVVNNPTYDTLAYDSFAGIGPGTSGFNATGVGIEEEALFDPVTGLFFLGRAATQDAMPVANLAAETPSLFNGTTADRQRGNVDTGAIITLSGASAGVASADQTNYNGRGIKLVIDITVITGTSPTLTVTLQGKDTGSGKYYTLLASTALNGVATTVLEVYPGIATAANATAGITLPRTFRINTAIGGGTPAVTATISGSIIV